MAIDIFVVLLLSKIITLSIYAFAAYILLSMLFEDEIKNRKCFKYYGDMTIVHISLSSKQYMDQLDKHVLLKYLRYQLSPDQCYINDRGELYLMFYKSVIDVGKVEDIKNIRVSFVTDDEQTETNLVKSVSVLGFSDKRMFMGYMSRCVILSCQRFLDEYYEDDNFNDEMKSEQSDSESSDLSMSLENYYVFPQTVKRLGNFFKETGMRMNSYNEVWGTWIKFNENNEPVSFLGFPINEETTDMAYKFIKSSYTQNAIRSEQKMWYESYGSIYKNMNNHINNLSDNVSSDGEVSTESESEEYVKL